MADADLAGRGGGEALREIHLIAVACMDVVVHAFESGRVPFAHAMNAFYDFRSPA